MIKSCKICTASTLLALALATDVVAAEHSPLVGSWKLISYQVESKDTGKMIPAMGEYPSGRVIFSADHRVSFVLAGDNRTSGKTDAEKAALLNSLIAYTGTEKTEGNTWCTYVDTAWNPEWNGTTQCRTFQIIGKRLKVTTPWRNMPNWPGTTRSVITFERE